MSALGSYAGSAAVSGLPLEVFDPAPVAVAACRGEDLVLVYTNEVYRRTFGDRPLGVSVRESFVDLAERDYLDLLDRVLRRGTPETVAAAPVTVRYAHGGVQQRFFSFSVTRVPLDQHENGLLCVALEVTGHVTEVERARGLAEERRRVLRRYESLVAAGTQKVWVADPAGRVVERSDAWQRQTGQSWEDVRGHGWLDAAHPEDRAGLAAAWLRAVAEVPDLFTYGFRMRRADGTYRHCDVRAVPVREGGEVLEWMGACVDVEERWQRERREGLLGRAASAVAESPDAPEAFGALSRLVVPELADECGIYLLPEAASVPAGPADGTGEGDGDGRGPLVVARVAATAGPGLPPGLPPRRKERIAAGHAMARAVRERRPVDRSFPPGEVPADFAPPGVQPWLARTGAHSGVLLPVMVDGAVAAVVAAFACGARKPIGAADRDLMRELVEQAHAPLSHALRLQSSQRVALALQRSLLTDPPDVPGLEIAVRYLPSPSAAEVGGDWYDSFVLPDGSTTLIIGDVAGHDLDAAVSMSRLRNMLRGLTVDRQAPPGDVLRRLDVSAQTLDAEEGTATCVLARVEGPAGGARRLNYSVAGHPPPLLVGPDGATRFLWDGRGLLLGGPLPEQPRDSATCPLPPGGTLLLYTDGLVERPGEDLDEGLRRLAGLAASLAGVPVESFCDGLLADPAGAGRDDVAMIALRLPEPPGTPGPLT